MEQTELSATEMRALIAAGEVSPVELLEQHIARIEAVNPVVNAVVTSAFDRARAEAKQAEKAVLNGDHIDVLHGLPVLIKDNQLTAGIRTTFGSPMYKDYIPEADAGIVSRIRQAGGIVIGKTNIPELSIGANTVNPLFGATRNPYDLDKTCGGSSGGSAVAVACNMAPLATGSDHGGSLRIPACYSGVVGYRATPGVVPNEERTITQTNYSLQGALARTVADVSLMLSVIARRDGSARRDPMVFPLDPRQFESLESIDSNQLKVAYSEDLGGLLLSDTIRRTFRDRVRQISQRVLRCEPHDLDLSDGPDVDWHLRQDVFVTQYLEQAGEWPADLNPNVRATYETALVTPMEKIAKARRRQKQLYELCNAVFNDFDVLLVPGVSVPPFPWRDLHPTQIDGKPVPNYMAWLGLTSSITVVGHPVVALPCGLDEQGTPFGIQLIGPMYEDRRLLAIARALEIEFANATKPGAIGPSPAF